MTKFTFMCGLLLALQACQNLPKPDRPDPTESKNAIDEGLAVATEAAIPSAPQIPLEVQSELLPELNLGANAPPVERRFDVNARDIDAGAFFKALVVGTPISAAIHPEVSGKISVSLKEVTVKEAVDVVRDMYGYDIQLRGRVLQVYPSGLRVETFPLNYLMLQRNGYTRTSISSGGITSSENNNSSSSGNYNSNNSSNNNSSNSNNNSSNGNSSNSSSYNGTRIESLVETNYWIELENNLRGMIGLNEIRPGEAAQRSTTDDGRMVVVSPQSGLVTIRAYPNEIRIIKDYLERAENQLQRQVLLEARIIEVSLSDSYQQGIDWSGLSASAGGTQIIGDSLLPGAGVGASNLIGTVIGGGSNITVSDGNFTAVLSLLETQGDVNVLSSPRITASNNQKAVIKVGTDQYFVTDVSNTTVTGTNPVVTPSVELTPFFSGIALDVTPQISASDEVLLHVHPSVTDVKEETKTINFGNDSNLILPLAKSDIRESDTVIKAKSGDVVVIGGLMQTKSIQLVSRVPFIGAIPGLGELFTNRSNEVSKTELVIMIRPIVVTKSTWSEELERSQQILREWYPED
ncbi:pilus (MSHA type) biogenesis protein MshL [Alginatibacterium sediminis]|uniref:Pilus (MSHA type) biogenesis protein MshL n=1 Tax=Alginatibacterium sediminis TaxID=2164068 RepID=A0A420ELH7_9ALTE|nr:pilus (MSHA type) biogenesis protein MshL [Alginatibacterium sediminis]